MERCELCSVAVPAEHRHLIDTQNRRLVCSCRACSVLFDNAPGVKLHYKLIPPDVFDLPGFELNELFWANLAIPVDLAFFFFDTVAARVAALYPGPMGAAESQLPLTAWDDLVQANPPLRALEPDVQALLVNRTRGAHEQWLVPIDVCYSLVGLIRLHWKGLAGGEEVWTALDEFFGELRRRASTLSTGVVS
ncbi:MAG: hypothetical protein H0U66_03740 [Gemmatimonadaceae bacterium]|nr:hypothetical protein [Gemmatimonadaceae bacterium]